MSKTILALMSKPAQLQEAVNAEMNMRLYESIPRINAPINDVDEGLERIHISPRRNPENDEIFWDPSEGKYYNKSSDMYLDMKDLKKFGLAESYECSNHLLAHTSIDIVDAISEGNLGELADLVEDAMTFGLSAQTEQLDIDESESVTEAKMIVKVNSKGERRRRLYCGKGRVLKDGVCVISQGSSKTTRKLAAKKAARTKHSQGAGYALKVNKKRKIAMKKRKAQGLSEEYNFLDVE